MVTVTVALPCSITLLNVFLHSMGNLLLWKSYNWNNVTTQQKVIFHISVVELILNCNWLVMHVIKLLEYSSLTSYIPYFFCIHLALARVLYLMMMFMTLDRLTAVLLGLKYRVYWTVKKTNITLMFIWCIGLVLGVCFILLYRYIGKWSMKIGHTVYSVAASFFHLFVVLFTYTIIFWKYHKSRNSVQNSNTSDGHRNVSTLQTFIGSRFYVSIFIVFTYFLFDTIPFCVIAFLNTRDLETVIFLLLHLGYTADAVIYIFLQKDVRTQFFILIRCRNHAPNRRTRTIAMVYQTQ